MSWVPVRWSPTTQLDTQSFLTALLRSLDDGHVGQYSNYHGEADYTNGGANFRVASESFSPVRPYGPLICDLGMLHVVLYLRQRVVSGCRGLVENKNNSGVINVRVPEKRKFYHRYTSSRLSLCQHPCLRARRLHNLNWGYSIRRMRMVGFSSANHRPNNDFECTRPR
jgi:hypothetical protein